MMHDSFASIFAEAEASPAYHTAGAALQFTFAVTEAMAAQGMTRAELARRIGTDPDYPTRLFDGSADFSLDIMVKIALALDRHFEPMLVAAPIADCPER